MKQDTPYTSIGGQAVIEGVMMRSPHFVTVAVRKPNGRIALRNQNYKALTQRVNWLRKPILRGVATLVESLVQGVEALSYSASVASESEKENETLSSWAIASSIGIAFLLGMGLFVALPHLLAVLIANLPSISISAQNPAFHLLDGFFKVLILLTYVYMISMMKDIRRVFQYHGAEHKSIYTFEAGEDLTVENARKFTTLHPRCGTSFLLFLVLISILVFSIVFPLFRLTELSSNSVLNHSLMVVIKILLMFPVAGLAYEFIKACAFRMNQPIFRALIWPGLVLQNLTTREPEDDQLEIALASLRQVLKLEKGTLPIKGGTEAIEEMEIANIGELGRVQASLAEFPEA